MQRRYLSRITTLGSQGFSHLLVPAFFVLAIGGIGAYVLAASHAATPGGAVQFSDGVNNFCLDNFRDSTTNYSKADVWSCNKSNAQAWTVASATNNATGGTIKNGSGLCLDVYHSKVVSGTTVDLFKCNNTAAQNWYIQGTKITNPHAKLCLTNTSSSTTKGTQVTIAKCVSNKAQAWTAASLTSTGGGGNGGGTSSTSGKGGSSTTGNGGSGSGSGSGSSSSAGTNCVTNASSPVVGCGFPGPTNTGVPSNATLTASGSITASTAGEVISDKNVSGTINVNANNVTINDTEVMVNSPDAWAIRINSGVTGTKIENTTITAPAGGSVEYAIFNEGDGTTVANNVNLTRCTECYSGEGTLENSYAFVNVDVSGAHYEDTYYGGGGTALTISHDTLLNKQNQTAAVYTSDDFGTVKNLTVTNSLLAGGGYTIYGGATGAQNIVITNNHFSELFQPKVGQYGIYADGPAPTHSGNVLDETGAAVDSQL